MTTLKALSISQSANTMLAENHELIHVHSTFSHGLNLLVNERLIFIGDSNSPFGIQLSQNDMHQLSLVSKDTTVFYHNAKLYFRNLLKPITVELADCPLYAWTMPTFSQDSASLEKRLHLIRNITTPTGFDLSVDETLQIIKTELPDTESRVQWLLGRGRGLTPSGDDVLLGYLAIIRSLNMCVSATENILSDRLKIDTTTHVSYEYLRYALENKWSLRMVDFLESLHCTSDEAFTRQLISFLDYGHTSGCDTLLGIAWGLEEILNKEGNI